MEFVHEDKKIDCEKHQEAFEKPACEGHKTYTCSNLPPIRDSYIIDFFSDLKGMSSEAVCSAMKLAQGFAQLFAQLPV